MLKSLCFPFLHPLCLAAGGSGAGGVGTCIKEDLSFLILLNIYAQGGGKFRLSIVMVHTET